MIARLSPTMAALRLRQRVLPFVVGGLALGALVALAATSSRHASPEWLSYALAPILAALVGIAKTTTA